MAQTPIRFAWTEHALVKAEMLGLSRLDSEQWIIDGHAVRTRNDGAGDWQVTVGRIVIVYNHPDDGELLCARIVTVWRRR
jgi:hypothetical protein